MFLERLTGKNLGEQVGGIGLARDMADHNAPGATQFTHLKAPEMPGYELP